jgi:UDP-N-acetylglucosamine acyltransferase
MATKIHPNAVVDPSVQLGEDITIGPFAVVGPQVEVGDRSVIDAGAQIEGPTRLGADNHIYPYACIGFDPQDLKFAGENTHLEVGDRNHFREHSTVHRGTGKGGGLTTIGSDNLFMAGTHIAHDCRVGDRTIFANNGTLAGHVEVGSDAVVGAFSSVQQFCRVGRYAYIGGYSVITRDALPFVKTVGAKPACYGVNRIGLERKGFSAEELKAVEQAYRILVRSKLNTTQALERLRKELGKVPHVAFLIEFVSGSERGVIREVPRRGGSRGG